MDDIDAIVRDYVTNAEVHDVASEQGDHKGANAAHDAVVEAYRQLRAVGDEGTRRLQELMEHRNDSVRCWAATHCLPIAEDKAESVLSGLAKGTGAVSFAAAMVLEEWRKGTLEIPT